MNYSEVSPLNKELVIDDNITDEYCKYKDKIDNEEKINENNYIDNKDINLMNRPKIIFIKHLYKQYKNAEITVPIWQRDDKWNKKYKICLIESIIRKRMIPMIYLAEIDNNIIIIDGGHRTRAICEYKDNVYAIKIDGVNVFYSKKEKNKTNKSRPTYLTDEEKLLFDEYPLPFWKYDNIDEETARDIFNELQHSRTMTHAEVCNSYASPLIDYLRDLKFLMIGRHNLYDILKSKENSFPNPDNHNYIPVLIKLFAIFECSNEDFGENLYSPQSALTLCKNTDSCLKYIYDNGQKTINDLLKEKFEEKIVYFFSIIQYINYKLKIGYLYSLYHYLCFHYIDNTLMPKQFANNINIQILDICNEYENELKKKGNNKETIGEINEKYEPYIIEWYGSSISSDKINYDKGSNTRYKILSTILPYTKNVFTNTDYSIDMSVVKKI